MTHRHHWTAQEIAALRQHTHMLAYSGVLLERIEAFTA